ncbi:MAG: hypothetical protein WAM21_18645 [Steroidobacteraceae bacterium]
MRSRPRWMVRAVALVCALAGSVGAAVGAGTSGAPWAQVAHWPDLMGGIWGGPGAGGPDQSFRVASVPLKPKYKALADRFHPSASRSCVPDGIPTDVGGEFFYSKGMIFLMSDLDWFVVRQIHMTRSSHDDPDPTYYGDSIGHWDGDTLVVDTVGFLPSVVVVPGVPGQGATHIIERFRLTRPDTMEYTRTVINPKVLTRPWVFSRTLPLHRDWQVEETYCSQNNRDAPVNGKAHIDLIPPKP